MRLRGNSSTSPGDPEALYLLGTAACLAGDYHGLPLAAQLATDAGGWRQVNRGGYPMIVITQG
jgi:hypothetical protein